MPCEQPPTRKTEKDFLIDVPMRDKLSIILPITDYLTLTATISKGEKHMQQEIYSAMNTMKDEVIRVIADPEIDIEIIQNAFDSLTDDDKDRMPYIPKLIEFER